MAHFAELDDNKIVLRVLVVGNEDITDENGDEQESLGIEFCKNLFGGENTWVQTSYNNNFRKNYAGKGYTYDQTRDAFIGRQPYPSWLLDEDTCQWNAPVAYPDDGKRYNWDEDTTSWKEV